MKKHEGNFILTLFSNSPVTFSQTWCHFTKIYKNALKKSLVGSYINGGE